MKRVWEIVVLSLVLISMLGIVKGETLTSPANVSYDPDLLNAFNNNTYANNLISQNDFIGLEIINYTTWARVTITFKDTSEIKDFLSNISSNDFRLRGKTSSSLGLMITKGGFYKLIENNKIERVDWVRDKMESTGGDILNSSSCGNYICISEAGVQYEKRILDEFNKNADQNSFVDIIIYLKNASDADNLISSFSTNEISRVINRHISNMISIEMTEEAFFKLIQDNRVESVYYNAPVDLAGVNTKEIFFGISLTMILTIIFLIIIKRKKKVKKC